DHGAGAREHRCVRRYRPGAVGRRRSPVLGDRLLRVRTPARHHPGSPTPRGRACVIHHCNPSRRSIVGIDEGREERTVSWGEASKGAALFETAMDLPRGTLERGDPSRRILSRRSVQRVLRSQLEHGYLAGALLAKWLALTERIVVA